jgi:hypothetical protein
MSHYYPKHRFKKGEPVSSDDLNEDFRDPLHEIQGNLGEQNWKKDSFTSVDSLEKDAAIRVHHRLRRVDPFQPGDIGRSTFNEISIGPANHTEGMLSYGTMVLGQSRDWKTVADMSAKLSFDNSVLWIMCDVQLSRWVIDNNLGSGVQFALSVDGAVVAETVTGSLDRDNEPDGIGLDHRCASYTIEAIYPITGGVHTIELVYRACKMSSAASQGEIFADGGGGPTASDRVAQFESLASQGAAITEHEVWHHVGSTAASTKCFRVHNRNMIIIEMR